MFSARISGNSKEKTRKIHRQDYIYISTHDNESFHPHITLVRPFQIPNNEEAVKKRITNFCKGKPLISFSLEGKSRFGEDVHYVPVINCDELMQFNNGLERLLSGHVQFAEKLNNKKILHATIYPYDDLTTISKFDQYMLRLTCIKDKKIWFSYDFITQKALNREESLDKSRWYRTVHKFTAKTRLLPTRNGYQPIQALKHQKA
jgi:2'-5' RNA ligase